VSVLLPDPGQFLYSYIRKEAVLSSQIEGKQSSLCDLLLFENEQAPGVPLDDVEGTSNYIAAMSHGLERIESGKLPLGNRLAARGPQGADVGRGGATRPRASSGATRTGSAGPVRGNARFVPAPATEVVPAMSDLEQFLHDEPEPTPILIKAALAHAQFETIHPFLDGNGRVGRPLDDAAAVLREGATGAVALPQPLLQAEPRRYCDHLERVRTDGAWEDWLRFFLEGVIAVAASATETARSIRHLIETDRDKIHDLGRGAASALPVHELASRSSRAGRLCGSAGGLRPISNVVRETFDIGF